MLRYGLLAILLLSPGFAVSETAKVTCRAEATCSHGLALWDPLKYPESFTHFDYTNPNAPKGGDVTFATIGSFDSLNNHILKGTPAEGLEMLYDSLIVSSDDEPFAKYGLLAHTIELAKDGTWVAFHLRPEARWHDGAPLTAADVAFSFDTIMKDGHPFYRTYFREVKEAIAEAPHIIRFNFETGDNRELPLILGQLPILPKHYYEQHPFAETTLEPPLGSGPYRIAKVDAGKSITYERVADYWGKDLPVNKGRYNFDTITYDTYRDATVAIEAFKAGEYDIRLENVAKLWAEAYAGPALERGDIIKMERAHERPAGMQGFVMNLRRSKFQNLKLRKALQYVFDFEWSNKHLFHSAYTRTQSFFENAEFASTNLPVSEAEMALLEPYQDELGEAFFTNAYSVPTTDGSGNNRAQLMKAQEILKSICPEPCPANAQTNWHYKDGTLVRQVKDRTGTTMHEEQMEIEFLLSSPLFERVVSPIIRNLSRLGIKATIRTVDPAQYIERIEQFDFDIIVHSFPQSLSPGNEQKDYWHSSRADIPGSRNVAGLKSGAVDALIPAIINAKDTQDLITATRALDRVLLHKYFVIPQYHIAKHRIAYWNKFGMPEQPPKYLPGFESWWVK